MQFCLHICLLCLPVVEYRLKAFVTHHGWTTLGGHYVCHVRQGDTWYHCNDSHVSKINISSLPKQDGYFFLYESKDIEAMQHSVAKPRVFTEHQSESQEHIQPVQHDHTGYNIIVIIIFCVLIVVVFHLIKMC